MNNSQQESSYNPGSSMLATQTENSGDSENHHHHQLHSDGVSGASTTQQRVDGTIDPTFKFIALYDFDARTKGDLTFKKGRNSVYLM